MDLDVAPQRDLIPLTYHHDLVRYLKRAEPEVWAWAKANLAAQRAEEVKDVMLRQTYRLEREGHSAVFESCEMAMARLGLDAPVTLYQAADGAMNAALYFVQGEIHLVFSGPTLERLNPDELLALLGHELAHFKLWSSDDTDHFIASRILDLALADSGAGPSHREAARLLSLHTELYADRGSALAVGDPSPAISMLVKVMTGLTSVDPLAYLRQAQEIEATNQKSEGHSHPESYLRARALDLWWRDPEGLEPWLDRKLVGPLSITNLDLMRQVRLTQMTRGFLVRFIGQIESPSEEVLTQARRFFPDFDTHEPPLDLKEIASDRIDDVTRDYFVALMFDCALADPEAGDGIFNLAARVAAEIGAQDQLKAALKRDLKWSKKATDALLTRAAKAL